MHSRKLPIVYIVFVSTCDFFYINKQSLFCYLLCILKPCERLKCVYSFKHVSETSNKKPGKPPYKGESRNLKIRIKESEAI